MSRLSEAAFEPSISLLLPSIPADLGRAADGCANLLQWTDALRMIVVRDTGKKRELQLRCEFAFLYWHDVHFTIAEVSKALTSVGGKFTRFGPVSFGPIHAASAHHAALEFAQNIAHLWGRFANCSGWMNSRKQSPESERMLSRDVLRRITSNDVAALKEARKELLQLPANLAPAIRAAISSEVANAALALGERSANPNQRTKPRRRTTPRKPTPLTAKQTEAWNLVTEHKGNFSEAAKKAGKSRPALTKLYNKACAKMGRSASKFKPKTQQLPHDKRGQINVTDDRDEDED